ATSVTASRPTMLTPGRTTTSALSAWLTVAVVSVELPRPPALELVLASARTPAWVAETVTVPSAVRLAPASMAVVARRGRVVGAVELVLTPPPLASQVASDEYDSPSLEPTRTLPPLLTCDDAPTSAVAGSLTVVVALDSEAPTKPPLEAGATLSMP